MLGCMAFSGPARIITTYFNKSAHMTIPLIQKQIFTYIFCLWLIYIFFHFGVLFCIIFTYYDNQSYILWKIKPTTGTIYSYLLTVNFYFHCAIWCSSYSIICCTTIFSSVISVGFKDKLIPSSQYTTVTAISIYFGPGDVWCWFTICDTL